jgi:hypothetical protein
MKSNLNFFTATLFVLSSAISLNSLAAGPDDANSKQASKAPTAVTTNALSLRSVSAAFQMGDALSMVQFGPECATSIPREWNALIRQRVETDLAEVFRKEIASVKTVSSANAGLLAGAEVNAFVNDLDIHVCKMGVGVWRGDFNVQVSWQVLSTNSGRVLYQASTSGTYSREQAQTSVSAGASLRQALTVAVRNLLEDRRFASLLRAPQDQGVSVAGMQ